MASATLERAVEKATGQTPQQLREKTISQHRQEAERRLKRPLRFTRNFPYIGRGNVMGDRVISHAEVQAALDRALCAV